MRYRWRKTQLPKPQSKCDERQRENGYRQDCCPSDKSDANAGLRKLTSKFRPCESNLVLYKLAKLLNSISEECRNFSQIVGNRHD